MRSIIIGNGILALTTAFRLARTSGAQDEIIIIGKKERPGSATLAAAAMLNSFAEVEAGALDSELDLYKFEMSHLATRMWPKFILELLEYGSSNLPPGCTKCQGPCGGCYDLGTYLVSNNATDELDDVNFNAVIDALKRFDEPYSEVAPNDIPNYSPEQRFRANRAIYIPNEGWLNPRLTMDVIESALKSFRQVRFIDSEVFKINEVSGRITSVQLTDGTSIAGDKFLLATGATTSQILERSALGIQVQKIFYGIGVSIEIKSPEYPHEKCIRTPNRGLACGLYTVPFFVGPDQPKDSIIIGASNFISPTPSEGGRVVSVEHLLKSAMEQINTMFYRATVTRINVGWRPTSSDTYPILGKTSIPNLVIASGTKRDGFHLSPLLSEVLAKNMLDKEVDPRFLQFAPERKLIRSLTREKAIEKTVEHTMNANYQHGFVPPHNRLTEQMEKMYRSDMESLHDRVGAIDWGIPPELIEMYRYGHIR